MGAHQQLVLVRFLETLEPQRGSVNTVLWAPAGGWLVLAQLRAAVGGQLIFVDASAGSTEITVMNDKAEHAGATEVRTRGLLGCRSAWHA